MQAIALNSNDVITRLNAAPRKLAVALDDSNDRADDIEFFVVVDSRHLGGFTADERGIHVPAGLDHAGKHLFEDQALKPGCAEVIQKEKRLSALAQDVVDAVVD